MANIEKLRYSILSSANIQTLKIGEIDSDPYFSNKNARYIFLNNLIAVEILIACVNQSEPIKKTV